MDSIVAFLAILGALSFPIWAVIIISLAVIIFGVEQERYSFSAISLILAVALIIWLTGTPIKEAWGYLTTHPEKIFNAILIYAVVGILYGVVKWFLYLLRVRDALVDFRKNYDVKGKLSEKQTSEAQSWLRREVRGFDYNETIPPQARKNKGRILYWMIWWPFSLPWTIINEPVKRFFEFIYRRIAGWLQAMSDRLFKDLT